MLQGRSNALTPAFLEEGTPPKAQGRTPKLTLHRRGVRSVAVPGKYARYICQPPAVVHSVPHSAQASGCMWVPVGRPTAHARPVSTGTPTVRVRLPPSAWGVHAPATQLQQPHPHSYLFKQPLLKPRSASFKTGSAAQLPEMEMFWCLSSGQHRPRVPHGTEKKVCQ